MTATAAVLPLVVGTAGLADAVQASQPTVVSAVPAAFTPAVNDGKVLTIAKVGARIVLGGTFHTASPAGSSEVVHQPGVLAFSAATGAIAGGFRPRINGGVNTVTPGPRKHEVYVAGTFTKVNGRKMRVALLDTRTGKLVHKWHPPRLDDGIDSVVLAHGRLYVGGVFTKVGKRSRRGLVALHPRTGKPTSYVRVSFTGHHNYRRRCHPAPKTKCATGRPGVRTMDVNPRGTRMVVAGDFVRAGGKARDQIALLELRKKHARVDPHWATKAYTARCYSQSFDSYIRDVQFSPGGGYFVVAATGGQGRNVDGTRSTCDAAARFQSSQHGRNVRPVWVDYSGQDSILSVAVTGAAVYVGGHQRWLNNTYGQNVAGPGAVPRPGLAALDPASGLPLAWNPGRNPRGAGCFALLATGSGLWAGSDTDYIGNRAYLRPRIAYFPLAGGQPVPRGTSPGLPGRVYQAGDTAAGAADPDRLDERDFDGRSAGPPNPVSTDMAWGQARGVFYADGKVFYGRADGSLYARTFDGATLGPEVAVDPYDDPAWADVPTGSGQTYRGVASSLSVEIPSVGAMFLSGRRLYYTLSGRPALYWRWFEPQDGIVGAKQSTVKGSFGFLSGAAGAFVAGHTLYFADQTTGTLDAVRWKGTRPKGSVSVVDSSTDWASRGLFLLP